MLIHKLTSKRTILKFTGILFSGFLICMSCKKEKDNALSGTNRLSPLANAGVDQTISIPIDSVELRGTGTDPDGNIVKYSWSKISGPASFTIISPNTAVTKVKNLITGVYKFELKVADNDGLLAKDTM